jgi:hypothetical protein
MRRIPAFAALTILLALLLTPAPAAARGGNSTYDFLRNDAGARTASLGGNVVTMTNDATTIFYNPAGIGTITGRSVSVGFFKHVLDINSGYVGFATAIDGLGMVGAGAVYTNYGEFKKTGEEGQDLGTFGAGELALSVGYGGSLPSGLFYGASAKFIYSTIGEYSSSAVALDLGVQYEALPGRIRLGGSLRNLGTQLDPYGTTREPLPLDLAIGATFTPEHLPASLHIGLHRLTDKYESVSDRLKAFTAGAEFTLSPNVFARVGYDNEKRQELKIGQSSGLSGFSLGAGFATGFYTVDYAYSSLGPIGALHRISISFQ